MPQYNICAACQGKQIFSCYVIERPDGVHMAHMAPVDCQVCHPSLLEDPWILAGWTLITEPEYYELIKNPSYFDHDI